MTALCSSFCIPLGLMTLMGFSPFASGATEGATDQLVDQPLNGVQDNGINVLLDNAHQFSFYGAWSLPPALRSSGFRVVGSQATLDTVLTPGQQSRVRFGQGGERPFGWWPNAEYNAVITYQTDPNAQQYLPEEISALRTFVEAGGGLLLIGGGIHAGERLSTWSLNKLAHEFGAAWTDQLAVPPYGNTGGEIGESLTLPTAGRVASFALDDAWQTLLGDGDGCSILAVREFGAGRVAVLSDMEITRWGGADNKPNADFLSQLAAWVSANQRPVAGSRKLPMEAWGGGAIYPELEADIGEVTIFYARNQTEESLRTITEAMPQVKEQIEDWLPSLPAPGRMYLILAAGGGGGWAINAYHPKEVGIISLDPEGILSVFAHELAHTMAGPPNQKGEVAGRLPDVFSEAHAGWFQGKIGQVRTGERGGHDPNRLFDIDPNAIDLDLASLTGDEHSKGWTKLWWMWQTLDERYGPAWYPRWLWVKSMRWQDAPDHMLTWDEVVEEMSIAVGEDLFPFFHAIGTSLSKERLPEVEFVGRKIQLAPAELPIEHTGPALVEALGGQGAIQEWAQEMRGSGEERKR